MRRSRSLSGKTSNQARAVLHGKGRYLCDGVRVDGNGEAFRFQARALAGGAGLHRHEALDLLAHVVGIGLLVAPLQVGDHAFEVHRERARLIAGGFDRYRDAFFRAVDQDVNVFRGKFRQRDAEGEAEVRRHRLHHLVEVGVFAGEPRPRQDGALQGRKPLIRRNEVRVEHHGGANAGAVRARAVRAIKGKRARLHLAQGDAAMHAGELLGEEEF